ncbi:MAG: hypothetical protein ACO3R2_15865 [bacterium]
MYRSTVHRAAAGNAEKTTDKINVDGVVLVDVFPPMKMMERCLEK